MNIEFYRPLWGKNKTIQTYAEEAAAENFTGLEGYLPDTDPELKAFKSAISTNDLKYIGEICTGGMQSNLYWIPNRKATVDDHHADFESELNRLDNSGIEVEFINCMGGLDAWPISWSVNFF